MTGVAAATRRVPFLTSVLVTDLDALRDPRRGAEQAREYRSQVFGF